MAMQVNQMPQNKAFQVFAGKIEASNDGMLITKMPTVEM